MMLAVGQNGLGFALSGLLFGVLLYAASMRTLIKSFKGERGASMVLSAWIAAIGGGLASIGSLMDYHDYAHYLVTGW